MSSYTDETNGQKFNISSTECNKTKRNGAINTKYSGYVFEQQFKTNKDLVCKPMTVEKLYEEILFVLWNPTDNSEELFEYMQNVFEITKDKHMELLHNIKSKDSPQRPLFVEVIRAENLNSMDSNGLSDPFVTLYIDINSTNRYNTAVVPSTVNPAWGERFLFPIQHNPLTGVLIVEVWDFDAAESVGEKMNKLIEVKGIRGFRKLLKEIALTASTGKHDNELIGRVEIPLKSISATGLKAWYSLRKGSSNKCRGSILLHLFFSTEKNIIEVMDEHRNLLKIFVLHELKSKNTKPFTWLGKFNDKADSIINRHSIQNNLSEIDSIMCQWNVYSKVHETHFLSLKLFSSLLNKLVHQMSERNLSSDNHYAKQFWKGYMRILPSCFNIVRFIRHEQFEEIYGIDNLGAALEIIKKVEMAPIPANMDLFPFYAYDWLGKIKENGELNVDIILRESIKLSTSHFLNKQYKKSKSSESILEELIIVIRSIISDVQTAVESYDKIFYLKSGIKYAALLYSLYQDEIRKVFFPKIVELCNKLGHLNILDDELITASNTKEIRSGTLLFDLYLAFKRFENLGSAICLPEENLGENNFYECFYKAVPNWLNISVIKTLTRIEKAIELDDFHQYTNMKKYTSSALDTLSLFYQMKYFWEQLDWRKTEECYLFVEKIVNDVCRCCSFYANKLSQHINIFESMENLHLTNICYAINDISYIKASLPLFMKELKINDILKKLSDERSIMEAERCSTTINNIVLNTVDILENKSFEIVEIIAEQFKITLSKIFVEGSEDQYKISERMNIVLKNFQSNIEILQSELQEESLNKLKSIIGEELYLIVRGLMKRESNNDRHPCFFENIQTILNTILQILESDMISTTRLDNLKELCSHLNLNAMETKDLIHQYYVDNLQTQSMPNQNEHGQLSIKAYFLKDSLHVHILNAYKLLPTEPENSCNSYVKVNFSPIEQFRNIQCLKTSVQYKTRCPLYDEQFCINLGSEHRCNKNYILIFNVKNKDLFGLSNHYIGECYISFADIEKESNRQLRLNLNRPKYSDIDILRILSSRTGDKQAKEFLKKLKSKS